MEPVKTNETTTPVNPLFPVMGIGSLLYALLYTICLYHNPSGISSLLHRWNLPVFLLLSNEEFTCRFFMCGQCCNAVNFL